MITIRDFKPEDAVHISELFKAVYEDRFVYPDMYVPTLIERHNEIGDWRSAVAVNDNGQIVGHTALWGITPVTGELGLMAVHDSARKGGLASKMCLYLSGIARDRGMKFLSGNMVSHHPYTQRLCYAMGYKSTALLIDYYISPFQKDERESYVYGILPLEPTPIPDLKPIRDQHKWLGLLGENLGVSNQQPNTPFTEALEVINKADSIFVTINKISGKILKEVSALPKSRALFLRIRLNNAQPSDWEALYDAGFIDTGLAPDGDGVWFWLMQRGTRNRNFEFSCTTAQELLKTYQGGFIDSAAA